MKRIKYTNIIALLMTALFVISAVPISANVRPAQSIELCTAEAEGGIGNPAVGEVSGEAGEIPPESGEMPADRGESAPDTESAGSAEAETDTGDSDESDDSNDSAATILIALVIAIALVVVIAALLPRKRGSEM